MNGGPRCADRAVAPRLLIADDQPDVLEALGLLLKREGYLTRSAGSPRAVLRALQTQDFDLLLMDLNYARDTTSGREGLDLLARVHSLDGTLPIVVMTAWGSVDLAVEAMHRGVGDFVQKPWNNARLLSILRSQIEKGRASRRARRLEASLADLAEEVARADGIPSLLETLEARLRETLGCRAVTIASALPADGGPAVPVRHGDDLVGFIRIDRGDGGRPCDDEERRFLASVAQQLGAAWGEIQRRDQDREIEAAREIQRGFLPREIPQLRGFDIAVHWQPARAVGGDYYDVLRFDDRHAALCIADVVGKGMPAALLMSNLQATVKACASATTQPADLCARVNRIMCGNIAPGRFISLFYGLLDAATLRLVYAGAGHNPPILLRRDGTTLRLPSNGRVLGVAADWSCRQGEIALDPGDRLVLFTDGVTEARNDRDEEFGERRLIELLGAGRRLAPGAIQKRVLAALAEFCPGGLQDDATLLTVAARGPGDDPDTGRWER